MTYFVTNIIRLSLQTAVKLSYIFIHPCGKHVKCEKLEIRPSPLIKYPYIQMWRGQIVPTPIIPGNNTETSNVNAHIHLKTFNSVICMHQMPILHTIQSQS